MPADHIATQAARWGADQRGAVNKAELQKARNEELEEMLVELKALNLPDGYANRLRAARSAGLAEQALDEMNKPLGLVTASRCATIKTALEKLRRLEQDVNNGH